MNKTDFLKLFFDPLKLVDPLEALKKAILKNADEIIDLNKGQLDKGLDANNKSLGKYKNFKYKNRFEPVDLLLTNNFRSEFYLKANDKESEIFSFDEKSKHLKKRYGKDIFGVPETLYPKVAKIIEPDFYNFIDQQVQKIKLAA